MHSRASAYPEGGSQAPLKPAVQYLAGGKGSASQRVYSPFPVPQPPSCGVPIMNLSASAGAGALEAAHRGASMNLPVYDESQRKSASRVKSETRSTANVRYNVGSGTIPVGSGGGGYSSTPAYPLETVNNPPLSARGSSGGLWRSGQRSTGNIMFPAHSPERNMERRMSYGTGLPSNPRGSEDMGHGEQKATVEKSMTEAQREMLLALAALCTDVESLRATVDGHTSDISQLRASGSEKAPSGSEKLEQKRMSPSGELQKIAESLEEQKAQGAEVEAMLRRQRSSLDECLRDFRAECDLALAQSEEKLQQRTADLEEALGKTVSVQMGQMEERLQGKTAALEEGLERMDRELQPLRGDSNEFNMFEQFAEISEEQHKLAALMGGLRDEAEHLGSQQGKFMQSVREEIAESLARFEEAVGSQPAGREAEDTDTHQRDEVLVRVRVELETLRHEGARLTERQRELEASLQEESGRHVDLAADLRSRLAALAQAVEMRRIISSTPTTTSPLATSPQGTPNAGPTVVGMPPPFHVKAAI